MDENSEMKDPVWGFTVVSLMFLPNVAFFLWFVHGYRKNLCGKERIIKICTISMVQLVTMIRLVKNCISQYLGNFNRRTLFMISCFIYHLFQLCPQYIIRVWDDKVWWFGSWSRNSSIKYELLQGNWRLPGESSSGHDTAVICFKNTFYWGLTK